MNKKNNKPTLKPEELNTLLSQFALTICVALTNLVTRAQAQDLARLFAALNQLHAVDGELLKQCGRTSWDQKR